MSENFSKKENMEDIRQKAHGLELLAPAQNKECAFLAIDCGADSVYIGANLFGARKNACNTLEDIEEIINYAHKFNVKIYVTINTILTDDELPRAIELIHKLHKIKTDGIIFQDFGILEAARKGELPDIKLISSTQCDNRNLEKVKFFEKTGVKRVILARELSVEKIREICANSDVEIESFVHGALCVSYSGQCYLSHKIGKRSANRGECAQACRKKYSLVDETGKIIAKDKYLLSLKDFMAYGKLKELIEAGVTSFKIEGRLKDANYIKNTVLYYRRALDEILKENGLEKSSSGKVFLPKETDGKTFVPDPKKSFNRDFCGYFLDGKRENIWNFETPNSVGEFLGKVKTVERQCFTLDRKCKITPQDGLCFFLNAKGVPNAESRLEGMLVNSVKGDKIYPNTMPEIKAGANVYRNKDAEFENILKNLRPKRQIGLQFKIFKGYVEALDEDKNIVTVEFKAIEKAENQEAQKKAWADSLQKTGNTDFYVQNVEFLSDEIYFLKKGELNEIRREAVQKLVEQRISNYKTEKQGKIIPTKFPEKCGNYRLNVHNEAAKSFYKECDCVVLESSYESGRKPFGKSFGQNLPDDIKSGGGEITAPKKAELMRTKHCIRFALNMCLKNHIAKESSKNQKATTPATKVLFLKDEKGQKYRLSFDCKNCEMIISEF